MMSMGRGKFSLVPDEHIDLRRAAKTGIPEDGPALFVHKTHDLAAARIQREATDAILCPGGDPESRVVAREHHSLAARVKAAKFFRCSVTPAAARISHRAYSAATKPLRFRASRSQLLMRRA